MPGAARFAGQETSRERPWRLCTVVERPHITHVNVDKRLDTFTLFTSYWVRRVDSGVDTMLAMDSVWLSYLIFSCATTQYTLHATEQCQTTTTRACSFTLYTLLPEWKKPLIHAHSHSLPYVLRGGGPRFGGSATVSRRVPRGPSGRRLCVPQDRCHRCCESKGGIVSEERRPC